MRVLPLGLLEGKTFVRMLFPGGAPGMHVARLHRAAEDWLCGIWVDSARGFAEERWAHPCPSGGVTHTWSGHPIGINVPSVVPDGRGAVLAACGLQRVRLDAASGAVDIAVQSATTPTGVVSLQRDPLLGEADSDGLLLVPEGTTLARYDSRTLHLRDRLPVPDGRWILAPAAGEAIPIQDEMSFKAAIWYPDRNLLWEIGVVQSLVARPVQAADHLIVPCGGGAPASLVAIDRTTGAVRWERAFPPPMPNYPMSDPGPTIRYPGSVHGDQALFTVATPALVALDGRSGTTDWALSLPATPSTFATDQAVAWIGGLDGSLTLVDTAAGHVVSSGQLPPETSAPIGINMLPADGEGPSAVLVTERGALFLLRP